MKKHFILITDCSDSIIIVHYGAVCQGYDYLTSYLNSSNCDLKSDSLILNFQTSEISAKQLSVSQDTISDCDSVNLEILVESLYGDILNPKFTIKVPAGLTYDTSSVVSARSIFSSVPPTITLPPPSINANGDHTWDILAVIDSFPNSGNPHFYANFSSDSAVFDKLTFNLRFKPSYPYPAGNSLVFTYWADGMKICGDSTFELAQQVNVTYFNAPDPIFISANPAVLCNGSTATLIAPTGYVSYLWSDLSTNDSLSVSDSGTYFVSVTDSNGCIIIDSIDIADNTPVFDITGSPTSSPECVATPVTLSASITSGCTTCTYLWSTGDTTSSININPISTGNYTLTITNQGCVSNPVAEGIHIADTTCCGQYSQWLDGTDFTGPNTITGDYNLNFSVSVTGNVTIGPGSNIAIAPGVTITISPNSTLNINGAHLFACGSMWNGIMFANSGKIDLHIDSSLIEDADTAIYVNAFNEDHFFEISNSVFNRNYVDIYGANLGENGVSSTIHHSTFECTQPLKSPYPNGTLTAVHLDFDNFMMTVGDTVAQNIIRHGKKGIQVRNKGRITSLHNSFSLLDHGIFASHFSELDVEHENRFTSCRVGIYSSYFTRTNIGNSGLPNYIQGSKTGIQVITNASQVNIKSNELTDCAVGISCINNTRSLLTVSDNLIEQSDDNNFSSAGIFFGFALGNNHTVTIEENEIFRHNIGIQTIRARNLLIQNNSLTLPDTETKPVKGIWMMNSNYNLILDNKVNGSNTNFPAVNSEAIRIENSSNIRAVCNEVYDCYKGLNWVGATPFALMASNIMDGNYHQFNLDGNKLGLGNVGHSKGSCDFTNDNQWIGTASGGYDLYSEYESNISGGTHFLVRTSSAIYQPQASGTDSINPSVLSVVYNSTLIQCTIPSPDDYRLCDTDIITTAKHFIEALEESYKIALDTATYITEQEGLKWNYHASLYKLLSEDDSLSSDSVLSSFHETLIGSATDGLMRMEDSLVAYTDTLLSRFEDSPGYNVDSLKNYLVELAIVQNTSINDSNDIDEYCKILNDIYIKYLAFDALQYDPYDEELLRNIAWLCPYQYGNAVYDARALLTVIDTVYDDYSNACSESSPRGALLKAGINNLNVYPNPSNGIFTLQRNGNADKNLPVRITDINGRIVYSTEIAGGNKSLIVDLSRQATGVYTIQVFDDAFITSMKLIIVP